MTNRLIHSSHIHIYTLNIKYYPKYYTPIVKIELIELIELLSSRFVGKCYE